MSRRNKLIFIAVIAVAAVIFGLKTKANNPSSSVAQKDIYYCPMHPTYTSDRPGTCPICNMSLVKKEEAPAQEPAAHDHAAMAQGSQQTTDEKSINKQAESICLMHNCPKYHDGQLCPMLVLAKPGEEITCPICGTHVMAENKTPL